MADMEDMVATNLEAYRGLLEACGCDDDIHFCEAVLKRWRNPDLNYDDVDALAAAFAP
jgi:hypothetical protein